MCIGVGQGYAAIYRENLIPAKAGISKIGNNETLVRLYNVK